MASGLSFSSALELLTSLFLLSLELLVSVTLTLSLSAGALDAAVAVIVVVVVDDEVFASSVDDFLDSTISSL